LQDTGSSLYSGAIANLTPNTSSQFGDYSANPGTNYGIGQGTLGTDASGPLSTSATTFDGSTGYIETSTQTASPGPQTFSIGAWFKTTSDTGSIIGFTNTQSATGAADWDRSLWLDPTGHVVFGLYPGAIFEAKSTAGGYDNGAWHFVAITVSPLTSTTGTVLLYVDGTLVYGSPGDETITGSDPAQVYAGYWHLGWSNVTAGNWTDGPTSGYWSGSLGQIAAFTVVLSPADVTILDTQSSSNAYASAVTGTVAASDAYWPLSDTALPTSPACSYIALSIQSGSGAGATCLYPAASVGCAASVPITSWFSPVTATIPATLPTLTFTTSTTLGATSPPSSGVGLHVSVPMAITESAGEFSATLAHNTGYVLL